MSALLHRYMQLPGMVVKELEGLLYCPYLHPELFREQGRIMSFTYCIVQNMSGNPTLMEVELKPQDH